MKFLILKWVGYIVLTLIYKTCRFKINGQNNLEKINKNKPVLLCVWHGRMLFPIFYVIKNKVKSWAIASPYNDGKIMAEILQKWNIKIIQGSSNRNAKNVLQKINEIYTKETGAIIAITNDGPKGPPRIAKPGAINLAYKLNAKIIFISGKSSSYWKLKTWDNFILPKPFASNHVYMKELTFKDFDDGKESIDTFITKEMNGFQNQIDQNLI